jgi:hypothetical protein
VAKAIYRASVRGARRAGFDLDRAGRRLQTIILDEFAGHVAPALTRTARDFAPHDTGRLERSIKAKVGSRGGRITVTLEAGPVSDEGYPYLDVTRYGHKTDPIYPVHAKALRLPAPGRGPGFIFRAWVRGYHPASDWVADAAGSWEADMSAAEQRLGRAIDARLL